MQIYKFRFLIYKRNIKRKDPLATTELSGGTEGQAPCLSTEVSRDEGPVRDH